MADVIQKQDLENAKKDADSIAKFVNGSKTDVVVTRTGEQYPSAQNIVENVATNVLDALAISTGIYATTAAGLPPTPEGGYFSVISANALEYVILYQKVSGTAVERKKYPSAQIDAVTINSGKDYPLRAKTRNGITSAANTFFNNAILNICIIGSRPGKYYRLAYFVNGSIAIPTFKPDGWIIEELNQANYSTANNPITTVINASDVATPVIERDGIQSVALTSTVIPDFKILITLDTTKLPANGTPIAANNASQNGYSYIIDPSRYIPARSDALTSININFGQIVPFRNTARGGSVSTANVLQTNVVLNARVINAKRGKYYGLRYFQNGSPAVVPAADNWIIEEVDIEGYDASTITSLTTIAGLSVEQPTLDRTLGIQTVLLTTNSDVKIEVCLDASKLQAYGTPYGMNASHQNGYSQVIDPACYEYAIAAAVSSKLNYVLDNSKSLNLTWDDGASQRGFGFGPNGANNLPNFKQVTKDGIVILSFNTDWLPPITFEAALNGDGRTLLEFTGGNHEVNGLKTATNVHFSIEADGAPLEPGDIGTASKVTCRVINKLMANNTVSLGRYTLIQALQIDFVPGCVSVHCEVLALEDLQLYVDYACQIVTTAVNDKLFYVGGQYPAPIDWSSSANSGSPADFPDAWAVITTSANGQLTAWVDRNYGIADGSEIFEGYGMIIGGGGVSTKQYTTAIHKFLQRALAPAPPNYMALPAGKTYKWRGGYSWGAVNMGSDFVAATRYLDEGRIRRVDCVTALKTVNP